MLIEHYQVYFVAPADGFVTIGPWLAEHINVPAWHHVVYTYRRDLLYGDYLIRGEKRALGDQGDSSLATQIEYGSDTFKTWEDVMAYFEQLGGQ